MTEKEGIPQTWGYPPFLCKVLSESLKITACGAQYKSTLNKFILR